MERLTDLRRFKMLVVGSQIPFRDAYDFSPQRALKWVQHAHALTRGEQGQLPTIVGTCEPLPDGEWQFFTNEVANSGVLHVQSHSDYLEAGFHQPTWYLEIETPSMLKRLKSYGAGALASLRQNDKDHSGIWAISLAISAAELLAARIPWSERLEKPSRQSGAPPLADLLSIE